MPDEPAKLLESTIGALSFDPLVGVLTLTTTHGDTVIAINRGTAEELHSALSEFLAPQ